MIPEGGSGKAQLSSAETADPDAATQGSAEAPPPRPLWNNFLTMAGIFLVISAAILLLTFILFSLITPTPNPYVDIVGYLLIPGILVLGLVMIPFGILFKSWRLRRHDPEQHLAFRFPRFDLNDPMQRRAVKIVVILTFIMLPVLGVTGYHSYHYTDSVQFCAQACHAVMEPEATTFAVSAHARVSCAECHIGTGASWFVKSKLSGTRQVFATLGNSYPRPIPPAITNLRPARETCERCHWPQKFYGAQLDTIVNFSADETNTRRQIDMLLRIGGGDESAGKVEGIHKHMALEKIEYIATDDMLQQIPWVKWTNKAGEELIYRSDGRPSSDPRPEGQLRELDCMDCHNRPAHKFRSPERAVDIYMDVGRIDTSLPYIKREAVAALVQGYPDVETAKVRIGVHLADFYTNHYPEIWRARKASVNNAIDRVREIYATNFFPDMKVDWRTYPDNIGHKNFAGCFRCHAGHHVNQHGDTIIHECKICHTFLTPHSESEQVRIIQEGEFVHPAPLEGIHADLLCHQCHTGGVAPAVSCEGCHSKTHGLRAATLAGLSAFGIEQSPMFGTVGCKDCHDISAPRSQEAIDTLCLECHEDEEEKYEGMLARWTDELTAQRRQATLAVQRVQDWVAAQPATEATDPAPLSWLQQSQQTLRLLDQAGPLHNHAAAMRIYESLAQDAAQKLTQLKSKPPPET